MSYRHPWNSQGKIIFKKAHSHFQSIYFNRSSIPKEEILFNFEKYNFHRIDVYVTIIHNYKGVLPTSMAACQRVELKSFLFWKVPGQTERVTKFPRTLLASPHILIPVFLKDSSFVIDTMWNACNCFCKVLFFLAFYFET